MLTLPEHETLLRRQCHALAFLGSSMPPDEVEALLLNAMLVSQGCQDVEVKTLCLNKSMLPSLFLMSPPLMRKRVQRIRLIADKL